MKKKRYTEPVTPIAGVDHQKAIAILLAICASNNTETIYAESVCEGKCIKCEFRITEVENIKEPVDG